MVEAQFFACIFTEGIPILNNIYPFISLKTKLTKKFKDSCTDNAHCALRGFTKGSVLCKGQQRTVSKNEYMLLFFSLRLDKYIAFIVEAR
jgi:hypothetical protein